MLLSFRMYLYRRPADANLDTIVGQARLRSSFIYLANAVTDLSGNWVLLGAVLAPLVLAASLCLLPDAFNLQHRLAATFESGAHNVVAEVHSAGLENVQTPYRPEESPPQDLYPRWVGVILVVLFLLITIAAYLVVLCTLYRIQAGDKWATVAEGVVAIYRMAIGLAPSLFLVAALQALATAVVSIPLIIPALFVGRNVFSISIVLMMIWLYFAKYAVVFEGRRGWYALLHSRELMRGRFRRVATRIIVFSAVFSGYNAWAGGAFVLASVLLGPFAMMTGFVWGTVFVLDIMSVGVAYVTIAFFIAAGARLFQDVSAMFDESRALVARDVALQPTAPLPRATA